MRYDDVKPGMKLRADSGFTCLKEGDIRTVKSDRHGDLYIECACGSHHLDAHRGTDGSLVGLELCREGASYDRPD